MVGLLSGVIFLCLIIVYDRRWLKYISENKKNDTEFIDNDSRVHSVWLHAHIFKNEPYKERIKISNCLQMGNVKIAHALRIV